MGAKIPEPIRRKVLREWVAGLPRGQIDILREAVIMLRREGLSIDDFAQSIHIKQFLNRIGLNESSWRTL
jgi:hypothetical protein